MQESDRLTPESEARQIVDNVMQDNAADVEKALLELSRQITQKLLPNVRREVERLEALQNFTIQELARLHMPCTSEQ